MKEKFVKVFCSRNSIQLHHLANILELEQIESRITGDLALTVLGIDNPTQNACISVYQSDVIQARKLIAEQLENHE